MGQTEVCPTYTSRIERVITSGFANILRAYLEDYILTTNMYGGLSYPICLLSRNIAVYRVSIYLSKEVQIELFPSRCVCIPSFNKFNRPYTTNTLIDTNLR